MVPKMHKKRREMADLLYDDGLNLFVDILSPEYMDSTMSTTTFDKTLGTLYDRVEKLSWAACGRSERNAWA